MEMCPFSSIKDKSRRYLNEIFPKSLQHREAFLWLAVKTLICDYTNVSKRNKVDKNSRACR